MYELPHCLKLGTIMVVTLLFLVISYVGSSASNHLQCLTPQMMDLSFLPRVYTAYLVQRPVRQCYVTGYRLTLPVLYSMPALVYSLLTDSRKLWRAQPPTVITGSHLPTVQLFSNKIDQSQFHFVWCIHTHTAIGTYIPPGLYVSSKCSHPIYLQHGV